MAHPERSLSSTESTHRGHALAEFQHRVKNLMANIRSIARHTAGSSTSLEDFAEHFDGRLLALTRNFRAMARARAFDIDLEELVREELLSQAAGERVRVEGPALRLPQYSADALGLAIHELAVNAMKYGALSGAGAELAVHWTMDEDGLKLEWRETGVAAVNATPQHRGFGREWIEQGLAYQLGALTSLEFLPGGVLCTIRVPREHILEGRT
jgi:two-component system CheB/CheR fusion protein